MTCETTYAYLAGIVDGEGSIGVYANGVKGPVLTIEVKMVDRQIIDLLCETFGGKAQYKPAKGIARHPQYRWRVRGAKAREVYQLLSPYLRLKRI